MVAWIAIIVIFETSLIVVIYEQVKKYKLEISYREIFLLAILTTGVLIVLITEFLSLFDILTAAVLRTIWMILLLLSLAKSIYIIIKKEIIRKTLLDDINAAYENRRQLSWPKVLMVVLILFQAGALLTILFPNAYAYPYRNW